MFERSSRHGVVFWARCALCLLALVGALATFLPLIDADAWWVRFLAFPRVQVLVALAVVLLLLLALPARFRPLGLAGIAVALAGIVGQAVILVPYSPLAPVRAHAADGCAPEDRLRVVAVNVQMTNENAERLFAVIDQADPNLILFQETDPWWDRRLAALSDAYPHGAQHVTRNYYGIHLLSNYPLVEPTVHFLTDSRDPSIFAGVKLPSGRLVRFYGIHPRPPTFGQSSLERDGQILAAALAIAGDGEPSILAGDLNATPWSGVVRLAARIGGLLDPRVGRGWTPTYDVGSVLKTWPLDHVLIDDRFAVLGFATLPPFGSDHLPVVADLCYAPDAADRQGVPKPNPWDVEEARRTIREAQNAATGSPEPAPGEQTPRPDGPGSS